MAINWKTLNEVPKTFRTLDGGRLSVEQCNLIYSEIAPKYVRELEGGRKDFNYAKARAEFMSMHKKRKIGNSFVWVIKSGNGDIQSAGGGDN